MTFVPARYAQTNIALYRQLLADGWSEVDLERLGRSYALALRLFASRYRAQGKPFVSHLVGTASVIAHHSGSPDAVLAGLLHAAYEQGRWPLLANRRALIVEAAGTRVEELVARFTTLRWPWIDALPDRDLVLMRLANALDDHLEGAMAFARKGGIAAGSPRALAVAACAQEIGVPELGAQLAAVFADRPAVPVSLRAAKWQSYDAAAVWQRGARWRDAISDQLARMRGAPIGGDSN